MNVGGLRAALFHVFGIVGECQAPKTTNNLRQVEQTRFGKQTARSGVVLL
jgi:hypothetical protein